jgi:deoxyribonuclease V
MRALHPWNLTPREAVQVQRSLLPKLDHTWDGREIRTVGGIDVGFPGGRARAAIAVLRFPNLAPIDEVAAVLPCSFPYVPGLLTFREGPAVLAAWKKLRRKPDLLMFDGQGIAHPRGIGIAAHLGLWLDRPSIGVAKSRLYGRHGELGVRRGDRVPLRDERDPGRIIGMVLRTRTGVRPVYVSAGHRIDLARAVDFVLRCCTRYRLPEPTRRADRLTRLLPGSRRTAT